MPRRASARRRAARRKRCEAREDDTRAQVWQARVPIVERGGAEPRSSVFWPANVCFTFMVRGRAGGCWPERHHFHC